MKVIAQTYQASFKSSKTRWLVELTEQEINYIIGNEYGSKVRIEIGTEINVSDIFKVANNAIKERKTVAQAVSNLRAMADLLESIEPTIRQAIVPPNTEQSENEKRPAATGHQQQKILSHAHHSMI